MNKCFFFSLLALTCTITRCENKAEVQKESLAALTKEAISVEQTEQTKKDASTQPEPSSEINSTESATTDPDTNISITKKIMLMFIKSEGTRFHHKMRFDGFYTDENGNIVLESTIHGYITEFEDTDLLDLEKCTTRETILKELEKKRPENNTVVFMDKQTKCQASMLNSCNSFWLECSTCVTAAQFKRFMKEAQKQRAQQ